MKTSIKINLGKIGDSAFPGKLWLCAVMFLSFASSVVFSSFLRTKEDISGNAYQGFILDQSMFGVIAFLALTFTGVIIKGTAKIFLGNLYERNDVKVLREVLFPVHALIGTFLSLCLMDAAFEHNPMQEFTSDLSYTLSFFFLNFAVFTFVPLIIEILSLFIYKKYQGSLARNGVQ